MKNNDLTAAENLALIAKSIQQTKNNLYGQRFYYLFWGWLVLITSMAHLVLAYTEVMEKPHFIWPVIMGLGFLLTLVYGYRSSRHPGYVETFIDRTLKHLWITIGSSIFIAIWIVNQAYEANPLPVISLLIGMGTLISGLQMRFKPLQWGGICFMVTAVVSNYITPLQSLLLYDFCIVVGYLIPGYLLKKEPV